jgi:hypothetical protein
MGYIFPEADSQATLTCILGHSILGMLWRSLWKIVCVNNDRIATINDLNLHSAGVEGIVVSCVPGIHIKIRQRGARSISIS